MNFIFVCLFVCFFVLLFFWNIKTTLNVENLMWRWLRKRTQMKYITRPYVCPPVVFCLSFLPFSTDRFYYKRESRVSLRKSAESVQYLLLDINKRLDFTSQIWFCNRQMVSAARASSSGLSAEWISGCAFVSEVEMWHIQRVSSRYVLLE